MPRSFERKNVCFLGMLYVDSEYAVVFPSNGPAKPTPWDVTVLLPKLRDPKLALEQNNGQQVWVIGDLKYDQDCWAGKLDAGEQRVCAPAQRPIYLTNGTLVVAGK